MLWRYSGVRWEATLTTMGLKWVFFIFIVFFFSYIMIYIDTMDSLELQCGSTQATTTTGPNDARHVFWALGEFFYFISFIYWYLMMHLGTTFRIQATARRRDPNDGVPLFGPQYHYTTVHVTTSTTTSPHLRRVSSPGVFFFFIYLIVLIINFISSF